MGNQYVKETSYNDLDKQHQIGFKEGRNEDGQTWKEDWETNDKKERWNYWVEEDKDGCNVKSGQWQEKIIDKKDQLIKGEKWCEIYYKDNDYWERKAESYVNYLGKQEVIKSGSLLFKNNRNVVDIEEWKEYSDGKLIKNKLN